MSGRTWGTAGTPRARCCRCRKPATHAQQFLQKNGRWSRPFLFCDSRVCNQAPVRVSLEAYNAWLHGQKHRELQPCYCRQSRDPVTGWE